jgi:hypothetical protein
VAFLRACLRTGQPQAMTYLDLPGQNAACR